ncbi:MAG: hypothetical protein ACRD0Z_15420 [Acidimicrobiales bacterium]
MAHQGAAGDPWLLAPGEAAGAVELEAQLRTGRTLARGFSRQQENCSSSHESLGRCSRLLPAELVIRAGGLSILVRTALVVIGAAWAKPDPL